ncbi:hypothetical protein TCSYLVIO_006370 [Trypanosoma cruzi]|nr:hypothetical protein TCSYLVIO_006370 [Trypanosoma cruzi]
MLPVSMNENNRRPGSRNNMMNGGIGSAVAAPVWEGFVGRGLPKADVATSATPTRNAPALAAAAAAVQQMRSPTVTTHQPYRGVPPSMFGVESELEGYTGINMENLVTVKAAYKTGIARSSGPIASGHTSSVLHRFSQRSPIAALESNDPQVGPIGGLCGTAVASMSTQSTMNGNGPTSTVPPAAAAVSVAAANHNIPARVGINNKRMSSIDLVERSGGDGNNTGTDIYRCPVALRIVETEEKHLNYTGVELYASEINTGETAERERRLQQRQRQVQYGKETLGYSNYLRAVPSRCDREFRNPMHPITPRPEYDCSKRTFDRYLNVWRRQLHLWDDYDPNNLEPQYVRIGIPTLRALGLELPPSTPEGQQNALISFTSINAVGGASACTPVMLRHTRREQSLSAGPYQRTMGYQQGGNVAAGGAPPASLCAPLHARPLSSGGGASWSITNTPHTPYHGSTHSTSSYPPPLLSVLAQPTIYSPHWGDSSRHSSPNPHNCQRGSIFAYHNSGGVVAPTTTNTTTTTTAAMAPPTAPGNALCWEGGTAYHSNTNNNAGYAYRSYSSPYGGHRYTPHSTPNQHHPYYAGSTAAVNVTVGSARTMTSPLPVCVGQETWGNPPRQLHP